MRSWIDSDQDKSLLGNPCRCYIESLGSISHSITESISSTHSTNTIIYQNSW